MAPKQTRSHVITLCPPVLFRANRPQSEFWVKFGDSFFDFYFFALYFCEAKVRPPTPPDPPIQCWPHAYVEVVTSKIEVFHTQGKAATGNVESALRGRVCEAAFFPQPVALRALSNIENGGSGGMAPRPAAPLAATAM